MKWIVSLCLLGALVGSCDLEEEDEETSEETDAVSYTPVERLPVDEELNLFVFGNSLVVHEVTPTPTEEKKVPHWLGLLAAEGSKGLTVDGRYGFLRQFSDFSELTPQWGFQSVESLWTDETDSFSSIAFDTAILTPTNFIQYQAPDVDYYDEAGVTPLSTSLSTLDQTVSAISGIGIYIYEGWPDMNGFGDFPSGVDLDAYYAYAAGDYHNWFITYHDTILEQRPGLNIRMIPVNHIMTILLTETVLSGMTITDLYEDDAPHGQPTYYFLASLIVYMSLYEEKVPLTFSIPTTVHELVRNNYEDTVDRIWDELQDFNFADGASRVFF
ncbi:MAG: T9SS C-terminal target domain-containing protein [Pseudobacteriovorax sp.]|nr:T9SS C-terminal target domain-containing protein [Pseudobacteriovorax sp.]